ncbi:MAG: ATP-dependent DNA helicase [Lachnospiraceae bacterium]|nr:ATP-dependent DNA helicase [Lachnospiraceae bacterium]
MEENIKTKVEISVREFVEFICQSGDIDNRMARLDTEAMKDGSRLHRKLQKSAGEDYRAEMPLKHEAAVEYDGEIFLLCLDGRADGIFELDETIYIDEIKTTLRNLKRMEAPVGVHRAQAMCYAYFYAYGHVCERIGIRMTYCNRDTEEVAYFKEVFDFTELKEWFDGLVNEYAKWAAYEIKWKRKRDASIKAASFPFEYREGQKRLVSAVYRTIESGKKLFVEAPTGVGKTMSTVFPAVWAVGEGKVSKIFYGTAKTIARTVAEEAFEILRSRGISFRSVTITAKEKLCVLDKPECNPEACERAKGHFDRVNDAVYDMLTHVEYIDRAVIESYAEKHMVCPFEMCLDVTLWADAVICDYNYIFDPEARLKRFFEGNGQGGFCLLIDEAHNLVERAREMYSAELVKEDLLQAKADIKKAPAPFGNNKNVDGQMEMTGLYNAGNEDRENYGTNETQNGNTTEDEASYTEGGENTSQNRGSAARARERVCSVLEACNKTMLKLKRETDEFQVWDGCNELASSVERFCLTYEEISRDLKLPAENSSKLLDVYFAARHFVEMYNEREDDYEVYSDYTDDRHFRVRLQCMDPAGKLKACTEPVNSTVMFSATLLPIKYYMEQLGGSSDDYSVYAPSPFDTSKRLIMVASDVSTKYTRRNEAEYRRIADYINGFVKARKGNYLVFFPSYAVMEGIAEILEENSGWMRYEPVSGEEAEGSQSPECERYLKESDGTDDATPENVALIVQGRGMSERSKEDFLNTFREAPDTTQVGFCVMGGIFSEGIDLKNDRLIGVVVVGTGLPMVCNERELFRNYFDERKSSGFEYAYLYNGMNKVMQASGRVIRTTEDVGAILLLDERFLNRQYTALFPKEWNDYRIVNAKSMNKELEDFWSMH